MRNRIVVALLLLGSTWAHAQEPAPREFGTLSLPNVPPAVIESVPPSSPVPPPVSSGDLAAEPLIDLRPPGPNLLDEDAQLGASASWLDTVVDDHGLIPRALAGTEEFVVRDSGGFGITSLVWKQALPLGDGPLWIAPAFRWSFLSGPGTADAPPQVYELGLDINFSRPITDLWGLHLQLTPFFATDFDNESSDAFRLAAGGVTTFQLQPNLKLVGGLAYLDRPDLEFLPIAGVRWTPHPDLQLDLLVPHPKLAWRCSSKDSKEEWLYLAGDVGGGSWAIERELNRQDRMGYYDLRLLAGWETREQGGVRTLLEAGYVFERHLEFDRYGGNTNPDPTFVLRWGTMY